MKTKRHCPQLWPLMKRFGWIIGFIVWERCRQHGCDWTLIPGSETILSRHVSADGNTQVTAKFKARCDYCESVKLFGITIRVTPAGDVRISSSEANIRITTKKII